jgi:hypothetical protein
MVNREDTSSSPNESGPHKASQSTGYVNLLLQRFPNAQAISVQLLLQNPVFRELCEEYEVCNRAAENLARSGSNVAMLREYKALQLRLEGELLGYMSQHGDASR